MAQDCLVTDPKSTAQKLNVQFNGAFNDGKSYTSEQFKGKRRLGVDRENYETLEDITATTPEVEKFLQGLNLAKAAVPHDISPRFMNVIAHEIAPVLTTVFQMSLATVEVPADWREALVTPIYRKREQYNLANYRPIALTSVSCKVMEHLFVSKIMDYLETTNIHCNTRHCFRKLRSCEKQPPMHTYIHLYGAFFSAYMYMYCLLYTSDAADDC